MTTPPEREFLYRKGKYIYFRHPGTKALTRLPDDERSQTFEDAYGPLYRAVKGANDPAPAPVVVPVIKLAQFAEGTIGFFVTEYLGSTIFEKMSENTQRNYRRDLENMRSHKIAHAMLHDMTPQLVDIYSSEIAKTHSVTTADKHATLISNLWGFARRFECFKRGDKHNPTIGRLRHHEPDEDGHLAWPDDVIDVFDARAISERPDLYRYRMGLHYTGQRGGDVLTMLWDDYKRGKIYVVQEKTGEKIWVACPAPLVKLLDSMPRVSKFIFTNSRGEQYSTADELSAALRLFLRKCGHNQPGDEATYTMHGLRKNAGMELALAGCNPNEIMAILGHKTPKMALYYCKQASKVRLAETASEKWSAHIEQEAVRKATDRAEAVQIRRRQIRPV